MQRQAITPNPTPFQSLGAPMLSLATTNQKPASACTRVGAHSSRVCPVENLRLGRITGEGTVGRALAVLATNPSSIPGTAERPWAGAGLGVGPKASG